MSPSRKSAWSSTRRSRKGCMPVLLSRSWNGEGGSNFCARTGLAIHLKRAAEGVDPLPHARQAQGPRLAATLAARGETLAIVGNDDPELIRPIGCEGDGGLLCRGVLANIGQGFLDEPEELERCKRWELVGRTVRSEAHGNLVPLFELVHVIP